jgi:hypothetical protein
VSSQETISSEVKPVRAAVAKASLLQPKLNSKAPQTAVSKQVSPRLPSSSKAPQTSNAKKQPVINPTSYSKPKAVRKSVSPLGPKRHESEVVVARVVLSPAEIKEKRDAERLEMRMNLERRRKAIKDLQMEGRTNTTDDIEGSDWVDELLIMAVPQVPPPQTLVTKEYETRKKVDVENAVASFSRISDSSAYQNMVSDGALNNEEEVEGCDNDNIKTAAVSTLSSGRDVADQIRDYINQTLFDQYHQEIPVHSSTWRADIDSVELSNNDEYSHLAEQDYSVLLDQLQDILTLPTPPQLKKRSKLNILDGQAPGPADAPEVTASAIGGTLTTADNYIILDAQLNDDGDVMHVVDDELETDDDEFDDDDAQQCVLDAMEAEGYLCVSEDDDETQRESLQVDESTEAFEQVINEIEIRDAFQDFYMESSDVFNISMGTACAGDIEGSGCTDNCDGETTDEHETPMDFIAAGGISGDRAETKRGKFSPAVASTISEDGSCSSDITPSAFADTLRFKMTASGAFRSVHHLNVNKSSKVSGRDGNNEPGGLPDEPRQPEEAHLDMNTSIFPLLQQTGTMSMSDIDVNLTEYPSDANDHTESRDNVDEIKCLLIEKFGEESFDAAMTFLTGLDLLNRIDYEIEANGESSTDDGLDNVVMDGLEELLGLDGLKHMNELLLVCMDGSC